MQPSFDAALGSLRAFFERLASSPPLTLRPKPEPATPGPGAAKQEAGGCGGGGGAQDMGAVLARAPLARWVSADTASFLAFLEASGCTLAAVGARYASLEAVAQDAVLDCFAAARWDSAFVRGECVGLGDWSGSLSWVRSGRGECPNHEP